MNKLTTTTIDRATLGSRNAKLEIKVSIVAYHDFSIDALVSMLAARDSRLLISCIEPSDTCKPDFLHEIRPDVLMIQQEVLCQPVGPTLRELMANFPGIRILVFGKNMDDEQLYRLVRDGVHGYVNERMNGDHIRQALDAVFSGGLWIERRIMERFIASGSDSSGSIEHKIHKNIHRLCGLLTRREIEVLRQVVKGLPIKRIAEEVHLSDQGVKIHLAKLFKKLGVNNRNQLILAAFNHVSPIDDMSQVLYRGLTQALAESRA